IFGFLIVMFVVILLLGNFRSGLIIATVIPLSLLFTISLMNIFHIDANLMSLGAIDFGIIIDGAVIIVEFIAFQITRNYQKLVNLAGKEKQELIDKITFTSTNKMMNSAIFGQLIIIIVFIPILSLSGVEGKMFKPMAMTFSFALTGAMIMGLTYVPVISSLFLKPEKMGGNFSASFMNWLKKLYIPSIKYALKHKVLTISLALVLLLSSFVLFSNIGGEFVPTLDEGDFVIQPVLKTGTSLSKTIELSTRMESILLDRFPEVEQVISRIGAAEVPTDPMSMEETDMIIKLKPIKEWASGYTKDELADKFKEALSAIPGVEYEFTQPIEMRFNELITGVRTDVAIKIFGEDLGLLSQKAQEIKALIRNVEGASDITVEKIEGLPQMSVEYDRSKLAKYGVSVKELNQMVSLAFAGMIAGSIFEGEKRFDLVVRLNKDFRKDIRNLQQLYVSLPNGESVPLAEMADIKYTTGPAKISRDDTKRRIVVGINVRNRDLESVVTDVQELINSKINLPAGYYISYGGQFENLRSAKKRLLLAVPVALLLIFIMLHFAFKSLKEAAMVYTAIPLSAVGGIALLWMRGMPFSISAGIGFIALFGIAVLNGIVLIEYFKELKAEGMTNINELIIRGTTERLRPILLTAAAAALGFFPMAISTSAGAEVQKPLATVVIGGLVTSTFLTLIVLPVLYAIYDKTLKNQKKISRVIVSALLFMFIPLASFGQNHAETISLEKALELAIRNNKSLIADSLKVVQSKNIISSAINIDKTLAYYNYDENNVGENGFPIKVWGIQQNFQFPTVYGAQKHVFENRSFMQQSKYDINKRILKKEVSSVYLQIIYLQNKVRIYAFLDSFNLLFVNATNRRYELGGNNYLEKLTALSNQQKISTEWKQLTDEVQIAYKEFYKLTGTQIPFIIEENQLTKLELSENMLDEHPGISYYQNAINVASAIKKLETNKLLPDLQLEYFQGKNNYANAKLYQGFSVGIAVPLFFGSQKAKIKASSLEVEIINQQSLYFQEQLKIRHEQLLAKLRKYNEALIFYEKNGENLAKEIYNTATKSYVNGEIDFFQYIISITNAKELELNYLDNLNNYNQTVTELKYISL
ncbi:MAG: CusA/CzcA family heavy metal efflux RND transporter, partial [Bacteroidales bacterium]|nr:CusA/CzcA family heavy metal efflux RND transporter [Bacteroidales bacterium]